jgi:hypothetical protein
VIAECASRLRSASTRRGEWHAKRQRSKSTRTARKVSDCATQKDGNGANAAEAVFNEEGSDVFDEFHARISFLQLPIVEALLSRLERNNQESIPDRFFLKYRLLAKPAIFLQLYRVMSEEERLLSGVSEH